MRVFGIDINPDNGMAFERPRFRLDKEFSRHNHAASMKKWEDEGNITAIKNHILKSMRQQNDIDVTKLYTYIVLAAAGIVLAVAALPFLFGYQSAQIEKSAITTGVAMVGLICYFVFKIRNLRKKIYLNGSSYDFMSDSFNQDIKEKYGV